MKEKLLQSGAVAASFLAAYGFYLKTDVLCLGGPMIILVIFCSFLAFAVIFEKWGLFFRNTVDLKKLLQDIFDCMERQRIKEAIELCDQKKISVARVLKAGIMKYDRQKDEIRDAMQEACFYEAAFLEERLPVLSTIVQVAPLLGFVGTLAGMMEVLRALQLKGASGLAVGLTDAAGGIWQALICSLTGFLVAVPALIAYNYFRYRAKSSFEEMERGAAELLNFLMEKRMPL